MDPKHQYRLYLPVPLEGYGGDGMGYPVGLRMEGLRVEGVEGVDLIGEEGKRRNTGEFREKFWMREVGGEFQRWDLNSGGLRY